MFRSVNGSFVGLSHLSSFSVLPLSSGVWGSFLPLCLNSANGPPERRQMGKLFHHFIIILQPAHQTTGARRKELLANHRLHHFIRTYSSGRGVIMCKKGCGVKGVHGHSFKWPSKGRQHWRKGSLPGILELLCTLLGRLVPFSLPGKGCHDDDDDGTFNTISLAQEIRTEYARDEENQVYP